MSDAWREFGYNAGPEDALDDIEWLNLRVQRLEALVKLLCSDPSVYGSAAFQKVRDQVNAEHKHLLFEVLGGELTGADFGDSGVGEASGASDGPQ